MSDDDEEFILLYDEYYVIEFECDEIMTSVNELKKLKEKGVLEVLSPDRSRSNRIVGRVLELLRFEALSIDQIKDHTKFKHTSTYNALRRLEKKGQIVALDGVGKRLYLDKRVAEKEGLLD